MNIRSAIIHLILCSLLGHTASAILDEIPERPAEAASDVDVAGNAAWAAFPAALLVAGTSFMLSVPCCGCSPVTYLTTGGALIGCGLCAASPLGKRFLLQTVRQPTQPPILVAPPPSIQPAAPTSLYHIYAPIQEMTSTQQTTTTHSSLLNHKQSSG